MKIMGIACSGRQGGNSEILVQEALNAAEEQGVQVQLITLADKQLYPCKGCWSCQKTEICKIWEDDANYIVEKMLEADGIIIGSPVHFWNLSANTHILIERTLPLHWRRRLRNKVGGSIVVTQNAGCSAAASALSNFFVLQRMIQVGCVVGYAGKRGEVRRDKKTLDNARRLGVSMVKAMQLMEKR